MFSIVKSYGIACVKDSKICMVRKRSSFKFFELMRHYKVTIDLLNQITLEEKLVLLSLDFDACERFLYNSVNTNSQDYNKRKARFTNAFLKDDGKRLKDMLSKSTYNPASIWEIPKGRMLQKTVESELECAVREFIEETGIRRHNFKVYPNNKFVYSFIDDGVKYEYIYFLAYFINNNPPRGIPLYNKVKTNEIVDMQWLNANEIDLLSNPALNCNRNMCSFIKRIIKVSKKVSNNRVKNISD